MSVLDWLAAGALSKILSNQEQIMTKFDELKTEVTETKAAQAALIELVQTAITDLNGHAAIEASLRQQLADAIAAGSDPAVLQGLIDQLNTTQADAAASRQALADALTATQPQP